MSHPLDGPARPCKCDQVVAELLWQKSEAALDERLRLIREDNAAAAKARAEADDDERMHG